MKKLVETNVRYINISADKSQYILPLRKNMSMQWKKIQLENDSNDRNSSMCEEVE